jgi:hypothetical protein
MFSVLRFFVAGNTVPWAKIILEMLSYIHSKVWSISCLTEKQRAEARPALIRTPRAESSDGCWKAATKVSQWWYPSESILNTRHCYSRCSKFCAPDQMYPVCDRKKLFLTLDFFPRKLPKSRGWRIERGFCNVYKELKVTGYLKRLGNTTCEETEIWNTYKGLVMADLVAGAVH